MPLFGARGGSPSAGGNRGNRRRGGGGGGARVVTVYRSNDGIYKRPGTSRGGGGGPRGRGGRGSGQGRGGGRGRSGGRGRGRGRGRGGRSEQGPSFIPEGKKWNDLTSEEQEDVERQRNQWKAAQLDKELVSFMAAGGKTDVATSLLDDDLEAYKRQGGKKKQSDQPQDAQPDAQQGVEAMQQ